MVWKLKHFSSGFTLYSTESRGLGAYSIFSARSLPTGAIVELNCIRFGKQNYSFIASSIFCLFTITPSGVLALLMLVDLERLFRTWLMIFQDSSYFPGAG